MRWRLLLLIPVVFLSGCSWTCELLVLNKTNETAVIRFCRASWKYEVKVADPFAYRISFGNSGAPKILEPLQINSRIEEDSICYVELPPGSALVVQRDLNLDLQNPEQLKILLENIRFIEVKMPNDNGFHCLGAECSSRVISYGKGRAGIELE